MNLPLATINIDTAGIIEVEVNAIRAETDLANGIADESLQRKVFGNAIYIGGKPPNATIRPRLSPLRQIATTKTNKPTF